MDELRIVFMGTPAFAVPSLRALLDLRMAAGRQVGVAGVFTQPDRPAGRGQRLMAPPVKELALAERIAVFQPERLRRPEGVAALTALAPDLIVVAAYAQILSQRVLDLPRYGCLNVHASLLPRHRGAAPIQAALLAGDAKTGVCIMRMEAGLDTGPVLTRVAEPIRSNDTAESLGQRLAALGADLLARTVPDWVTGVLVPQPQDESQATMTRLLSKDDGLIDWYQPAAAVDRHVRAMFPWPGAYTIGGSDPGVRLKVLAVEPCPDLHIPAAEGTLHLLPNTADPAVVCRSGVVVLRQVQPAGRTPMTGAEWLRRSAVEVGSILGSDQAALRIVRARRERQQPAES